MAKVGENLLAKVGENLLAKAGENLLAKVGENLLAKEDENLLAKVGENLLAKAVLFQLILSRSYTYHSRARIIKPFTARDYHLLRVELGHQIPSSDLVKF